MWEKGGSLSGLDYRKAKKYVAQLNEEKFLGQKDWRMPTIEELISLMEPDKNENGLHVNAVFGGLQEMCWSSDGYPSPRKVYKWFIDFSTAQINEEVDESDSGGLGEGYRNFVKAVRTIK